MDEKFTPTPVRVNLAEMLLQLKDVPAEVIAESLSKLCTSYALTTPKSVITPSDSEPRSDSSKDSYSDNSGGYKPAQQALSTSAASPSEIAIPLENVDGINCNCRKSRCLKLYCQCFAIRAYCIGACNCVSCANNAGHIAQRKEAIVAILERNPNAFDDKFKPTAVSASVGIASHKNGCRCRKSMCLKKYCECYQAAVPCSITCSCLHCCNKLSPSKTHMQNEKQQLVNSTPQFESEAIILRAAEDLALLREKEESQSSEATTVSAPKRLKPNENSETSSISSRPNEEVWQSSRPPLPPNKRKRQWSELAESQVVTTIVDRDNLESILYTSLSQHPQTITNAADFRSSEGVWPRSTAKTSCSNISNLISLESQVKTNSIGSEDSASDKKNSRAEPYSYNLRAASPNSFNCASALSLLCGVSFVESDESRVAVNDFQIQRFKSGPTNDTTSEEDSSTSSEATSQSALSPSIVSGMIENSSENVSDLDFFGKEWVRSATQDSSEKTECLLGSSSVSNSE